ncbi:MAG: hypothetical protein OXG51_05455 [Gammaproteobacteria bacterium]|nr:hypothetical protein [Gammaproteobacteria bacterium]
MLAAVVLGMPLSAGASEVPTVSDCQDAWSSSSAAQSCGLHQVHNVLATVSVENDQCKVNVDCSTSLYFQHLNQTFSGSVDDMKNLHNCNGHLKVDGC